MTANGKRSGGHGEGGHSVGLWYVSFSDMITLLLSFFVILTTFSSFDSGSRKRFRGVIRSIGNYTIFPSPEGLKDSYLPALEGQIDWTEFGSEMPTGMEPREVQRPRKMPLITSTEAYHDRKSFYVPSSQMFWGKGSRLTPNGEAALRQIAQFVQMVPCQVIIREIVPDGAGNLELRLERAWIMRSFVIDHAKLPKEWFNISASASAPQAGRQFSEAMMEVRLVARSVAQ